MTYGPSAEQAAPGMLSLTASSTLAEIKAAYDDNVRIVYETRGDPGQARDFWVRSVELYRRIGVPHMVQKVQGWIDGLEKMGGDS